MNQQANPRSEYVLIPPPNPEPRSKELPSNTRPVLLAGGGVFAVVLLVVAVRLTFYHLDHKNKDTQVPGSTDSNIGPSSTPSLTSECVIYKKKKTFSGSADYCKTRNSRLLNEEDTKTAAHCITRGEDFWAAPVSRNDGECFIYNTDHGFVQMDCLTPRWFICLQI
ncbi:uncharacterized protein ACNLHF_012618 [Anomaloglossus baeobatrachus]